jgi:quercetin dioxygenase-like cupin family protein
MHLDDFPRLAGPGSLTWIPVRHTLGLRAFGTNAYEAERIGQDVVEPHAENPELAHQELYFVARGRARFILDGHEHDAPAGTYVFVPDPRSHRHAVAEEDGTIVLSFGGPPTFEPSLWETTFRASAIAEDDPAGARALMAEAIDARPDDAKVCYNAACLEARIGDVERTCELLARAIELEPRCAKWASADEDFARVADDDGFRALVD